MEYSYVLTRAEYDRYMELCGTEEGIIKHLNETLSLNHIITNLIVQK